MQTITLEFENEKEVRDEADRLWRKVGITGEMGIRPLGNGHWRLEVNSERELKQSVVEKLKGRVIDD